MKRSKALWVASSVAVGAVLLASSLWKSALGGLDVEAERAAAREACLPLSAEEVRTKLSLRRGENAAEAFRSSFKAIRVGAGSGVFEAFDGLRSGKATQKQKTTARARIDSLVGELDRVEAAAKLPRLDYNRPWEKGMEILLPELSDSLCTVRVLLVDAELATEEGNLERANRRYATAAQISRLVEQEPIFISGLVALRAQNETLASWLRAFGSVRKKDSDALASAGKGMLEILGPDPNLRAMVYGETAMAHESMTRLNRTTLTRIQQDFGFRADDIDPVMKSYLGYFLLKQGGEAAMLRFWRTYHESLPKSGKQLTIGDVNAARSALASARDSIRHVPPPARYFLDATMAPLMGEPADVLVSIGARKQLVRIALAVRDAEASRRPIGTDLGRLGVAKADQIDLGSGAGWKVSRQGGTVAIRSAAMDPDTKAPIEFVRSAG